MKHIKISFLDFWEGFKYSNMNFYKLLCERYDVEVVNKHEDAEYVFFSCFGIRHWEVSKKCIKIFITAENISPDFNSCDYAIAFDWLIYGERYLRLSNIYSTPKAEQYFELIFDKEHIPTKNKFCSFVVSNSNANDIRTKIFFALSEYKKVDSGGKYLNNIGGPVKDKLEFDNLHKFSICCENASSPGYTTEKLYHAFAAHTIPIYWGDPEIAKIFNTKAFINVMEYNSIDEVVKKVKEIDNNDELYKSMLNEPTFNNPDEQKYEYQLNKLRCFLYNIFDKDITNAYKYNRTDFHFAYQNKIKELIRKSRLSTLQLFKELFLIRLKSLIKYRQ